jgi:hypothetical protein
MAVNFFPSRDSELLAWSLNFKTLITASPTTYGLTAPLATAYGTLHTAYADALAACDPAIRTKSAVAAKNLARTNLKNNARLLANLVNGTASVTDAQKLELGLTVRAQPAPVPPPSSAPAIEVVSVIGWTAKVRLKNTETIGKRGKPAGVLGANVFSHVGATPPTDIGAWKFEGGTGRVTVDVVFPNTLAAGTTVWLTAFWFNGRKQSGPACAPVSCNLPGGSVSMAA